MKYLFFISAICIALSTQAQTQITATDQTASVRLVLGVPVFLMADPVRPYVKVDRIATSDPFTAFSNGMNNTTVDFQALCENTVNYAEKLHNKGKLGKYDAIIIQNASWAIAIRYTDTGTR